MSCCPGLRCKNTGSGYVKPDGDSAAAKELEKRMAEMLQTRSAQDAGLFAPVRPAAAAQTQPSNLNTSLVYKPGGR